MRSPGAWQRVIHGDAKGVREIVVENLISEGHLKRATRFALCGCGDQLVRSMEGGGGGVTVQAMGCGHPLCPRCGRRRGGRYARRVLDWLAYEPHGELWNVCFTQEVVPGEGLKDSRKRLAAKLRVWMTWATRQGMTAAMTVHHIVWSTKREGWHYHCHALIEFNAGSVDVEALQSAWAEAARKNGEWVRALWCGEKGERPNGPLLPPGPAITELQADNGDPEFWSEVPTQMAKIVQYPLRDIAQGVSAWRLGGDPELMKQCVVEVLKDSRGWKMRRAWGKWRKASKVAADARVAKVEPKPEAEGEKGEPAKPGPPKGVPLGRVNRIWKAARQGNAEARGWLRALEASCRNDTEFARRLVVFVRVGCGQSKALSG